ncbi:MAG: hypothetical protein R6X19_05405 [Kiritimatiellia bacterium]
MEKADKFEQVLRKNGEKIRYLFVRNGVYYSLFRAGSKTIRRCCPYSTQTDAEKWVVDLRRELVEGIRSQRMNVERMRSEHPTLKQVCDAYQAMVPGRFAVKGSPSQATGNGNVWKIGRLLAEVHGVEDAMGLRLGQDVIGAQTVERFILKRVQAARDPIERKRAHDSATSTLVGARSLFARWTRAKYAEAGVSVMPNLEAFCGAIESSKPNKYRSPPEELVQATLKGVADLPAEQRAVFILCYYFGLRRGEAMEATWDWVERYLDTRAIRVESRVDWAGPKNKKSRRIPATAAVWEQLEAVRNGEFLIPVAGRKPRKDAIVGLSTWMRTMGWDRKRWPKTLHELRKIAGSTWCQKAGADRAAEWLGDTMGVVMHYYVDVIGRCQPVEM